MLPPCIPSVLNVSQGRVKIAVSYPPNHGFMFVVLAVRFGHMYVVLCMGHSIEHKTSMYEHQVGVLDGAGH